MNVSDPVTQAVVSVALVSMIRSILMGQFKINLADGTLQLLSLAVNILLAFGLAGATSGVTAAMILPLVLQSLAQFAGVQGGYVLVKGVSSSVNAQVAGIASAPTVSDAGQQLGLPTIPFTPPLPPVASAADDGTVKLDTASTTSAPDTIAA